MKKWAQEVLTQLSVQLRHVAFRRALMRSVSQGGGHCLRACLEQQLRLSLSASCCCAPLPNSILSWIQSADTVLLACDSCQLGQVTCYCQGGFKQLRLLQHPYTPDHVASG